MDVGFKQIWWFLFPTHLKEYAKVKWDHFPKQCSGWKCSKNWVATTLNQESHESKKKHQIHPLISPVFLFRLMRFTRFNHSTLGRSSEGHLWTVCLVTSWWLLRWSWRIFNGKPSQQKNTAWMFKVATENISSQKETSIRPIFFQGLCSTSGVYYEKCPLNSCDWSEKICKNTWVR